MSKTIYTEGEPKNGFTLLHLSVVQLIEIKHTRTRKNIPWLMNCSSQYKTSIYIYLQSKVTK